MSVKGLFSAVAVGRTQNDLIDNTENYVVTDDLTVNQHGPNNILDRCYVKGILGPLSYTVRRKLLLITQKNTFSGTTEHFTRSAIVPLLNYHKVPLVLSLCVAAY